MGDHRTAYGTPQEKKRLSYDRDRRNSFGENDKSSRKNIRRNKRYPNRANRRHDRQVLGAAVGVADEHLADRAEHRLHAKRRKRWRKWPDAPLGVHVEATLEQRQHLEGAQSGHIDARLRRLRGRFANGVKHGTRR